MSLNISILSVFFLFFCGITSGNSQVTLLSTSTLSDTSYVIAANNIGRNPHNSKKKKNNKKSHKEFVIRDIENKLPYWRKNEKAWLKKHVAKYNAYLKKNTVITEGIIAHEGGIHKGHTIKKHVGVSKANLNKRIKYEKAKKGKHDNKVDHKDLTMELISSFKNLKEADRFIDTVLADKSNQHILKNWVKEYNKLAQDKKIKNKSENKKKRKDLGKEKINKEKELYEDKVIELSLNNFKKSTGLAVDPKTKKLIEAKGVKVFLTIDKSNNRGWSILTAYPIR